MKTIRFDRKSLHHSVGYVSSDMGNDQSGDYVPAEVAQGLYEALKILISFAPKHYDDEIKAREKAQEAIKKADDQPAEPSAVATEG